MENAMGTSWTPSDSRESRQDRVMAISYGGSVTICRVTVTKDRYAGIVAVGVYVDPSKHHIAGSLAQKALSMLLGFDIGWRNLASTGTWKYQGQKATYASMRHL